MARKEPTESIKVGQALADRSKRHAQMLDWSFNKFGEHAIMVLCDMIEDPDARKLPRIVAMLAAAREQMPDLPGADVVVEISDKKLHLDAKKKASSKGRYPDSPESFGGDEKVSLAGEGSKSSRRADAA